MTAETVVQTGAGAGEVTASGAGGPASGRHPPSSTLRPYRPRLPNTWWLRNRRYFLFMLRDFSALPIALWLLWLLVQISRVGAGPDYRPSTSIWYVVFSVVCLAFALLHSVTWLNLSGVILRVPLGERDLSPNLVTAANYAMWAVATLVIGTLLIVLGIS